MRMFLIPLVLAGLCQAAHAGTLSSAYTDLDADKDCTTYAQAAEGEGDWADLVCSGYRGYPVFIAYGDARESPFYGFPSGDGDSKIWESFSAFNSTGPKVEWRIETEGERAVPFATIHRWFVSDSDNPDHSIEVLVVAKVAQIGEGEGCAVGLVLATGNPRANEAARKIADEKARGFACGRNERVVVGDPPAFYRQEN